MTEPARTRRVPVRQWTCPHHPDGPPTLPAEGYEREELTLEQAYDVKIVNGLTIALNHAMAGSPEEDALRELGVCCIGHEWKTVGYTEQPIGSLEGMLVDMSSAILSMRPQRSVLLSELAHGAKDLAGRVVSVPLVTEPDPETHE